MGLDESKMNRFSCVMQPGLKYKEAVSHLLVCPLPGIQALKQT